MSKAFSDLGKDCEDIINTGFPSQGSSKLVIEVPPTTTDSSIKITIKRNKKDEVEGIIEPKHEWKSKNIELTGRAVTSQEYEGGFSLKDFGWIGSKISVTSLVSRGIGTLKGNVAFKNKNVNTKIGISYPLDVPFTALGEVVFNYPSSFFGGVSGQYDVAKNLFAWSAAIAYVAATYQGHLSVKNRRNSLTNEEDVILGAGWYQELNRTCKVGVNFSVSNNKDSADPSCNIASEVKVDPDTILKGKIGVQTKKKSSDLRVGLGLKQKISSHLTFTIGADLNGRTLLHQGAVEGEGHSLGFEIKLS